MEYREIVFLIYHELELPGRNLCQSEPGYARYILSSSDFQHQMRLLKDRSWRGFSVSEALEFPAQPGVAITFDDGCETDVISAAPVLREAGFGATFYVSADFLDKQGYLSSAQLRQLCDLGFEIGCHSMTHAYLNDLDQRGLQREIGDAKMRLEQVLGRAVEHFSCPGGRYDQRVISQAEMAGYKSLATSRIQTNSALTPRFKLGRVAIMRNVSIPAFDRICHAQRLWQLSARDHLRLAARRAMGNKNYDRLRRALLR